VVLSELDGLKKGMSERALASREASRFLEDLAARDRQALRFARFGTAFL
jgi:predicted ribonuclease YlaK